MRLSVDMEFSAGYNYYHTDKVSSLGVCVELSGTVVGIGIFTAFYLGLVQLNSSASAGCNSSGQRVPNAQLRAAYQWHGLTVGLLIILCVFITVVSVKEEEGR